MKYRIVEGPIAGQSWGQDGKGARGMENPDKERWD